MILLPAAWSRRPACGRGCVIDNDPRGHDHLVGKGARPRHLASQLLYAHVWFGGERLVLVGNQDPASYPTRPGAISAGTPADIRLRALANIETFCSASPEGLRIHKAQVGRDHLLRKTKQSQTVW